MSRSYYSEINLHIIWHTKDSLPLLTTEVEPLAHRFLKKRIMDTPGAFFHEVGGIETHVHVVVTVPPTLLISDFIGKIKGGTSHDVNKAMGLRQNVLEWQNGYGVVSFGTRDLPWVTEYARNQREHHAGDDAREIGADYARRGGCGSGSSRCRQKARKQGLGDVLSAGYPVVNEGAMIAARGRVVNEPQA